MYWEFDRKMQTWITGDEINGIGIVQDWNEYWANIVIDDENVETLGPFDDLEYAKESAEEHFQFLMGVIDA